MGRRGARHGREQIKVKLAGGRHLLEFQENNPRIKTECYRVIVSSHAPLRATRFFIFPRGAAGRREAASWSRSVSPKQHFTDCCENAQPSLHSSNKRDYPNINSVHNWNNATVWFTREHEHQSHVQLEDHTALKKCTIIHFTVTTDI